MKNKNKIQQKFITALIISIFSAIFIFYPKINLQAEPTEQGNETTNEETASETEENEAVEELNELDEEELQNEIDKLRDSLGTKKNEISDLEQQIANYQKIVEQKEQELLTVRNQIESLDTDIAQTDNQIRKTELEIEKNQLEILETQITIEAENRKIKNQKKILGEYVRQLYQKKRQSYLEIILIESSFSDFFQQLHYLEESQKEVNQTLKNIKGLKEELTAQQANLEEKEKQLYGLNTQLASNREKLSHDKAAQQVILEETMQDEEKFQELLESIHSEQAQINGEITTIERRLRQKIIEQKRDRGEEIPEDGEIVIVPGEGVLSWPLLSNRTITAYFYDPTYPYRRFFEHPGIDIDTQGPTQVLSAADGIIGIVKNLGWVRDENGNPLYPAYNYVLIVHDNGLSTVYGHLSQINITEGQEVVRGQVIALSGGTPGTAGAGRLTTGDHLHFEVRLNGIPVNPLEYLP